MKQLDHNSQDAEHRAKKKDFPNSSELPILEYLENILGRFDSSTTFKRLGFLTVLSEQHPRHRL